VCPTVGGGENLHFTGTELADWIGFETFTMEVCIEERCEVRQVESVRRQVIALFMQGADDMAPGDPVRVTLRVTHDDTERSAESDLVFEVDYPNGRRCGPACLSGLVRVGGDELEAAPLQG
jgi:hypothetical protein